jgi:hypothetical protein
MYALAQLDLSKSWGQVVERKLGYREILTETLQRRERVRHQHQKLRLGCYATLPKLWFATCTPPTHV